MSGGSMNYAYHHINDIADYVSDKEIKELLEDLAELIHDLEWWESSDYSKGQYLETLYNFKAKWFGNNRDERLIKYIDKSLDDMKAELYELVGAGDENRAD